MIDWPNVTLEELAAIVSSGLKKQGIDTVLVGGACVTIYSKNRYQTYDLDYATYDDMKAVKKAMENLGFRQMKRKYFERTDCRWLIEFVSPPVAVGNEPIQQFQERQTQLGSIRMLRPEDSVKDRLASYFHWDDRQSLEQAIDICFECKVNIEEIKAWAVREKNLEKLDEFISLLRMKQ